MPAGRPLKFKSPKQLLKKGLEYFAEQDKNAQPYTITGLANYLDTSRETLMNYEERDEYFDTIKKLKQKCEEYAEIRLFSSTPTGAIFALKNFGWKDKQETDITSGGKPLPLLANMNVSNHHGDTQDSATQQAD
jgi:hypothetical protein